MSATAVTVRVEGIPAELKRRAQWVLWKREDRGNGPTKVPYSPRGGRASSTDLMTWGTFEEVLAVLDRYDGLGFVFCSGDPYTGVDLDGCRDPEAGHIEPWAVEIIEALDSYAEVSPSGKGIHIVVKGKVPTPLKRPCIEIYSTERYFTVTGRVLERGA